MPACPWLSSPSVQLTIYFFTLPLPFLPPAPALSPYFLAGVAVLLAGLGIFNAPIWLPALRKQLESWAADHGDAPNQLATGFK